jgi:hypothetical protein
MVKNDKEKVEVLEKVAAVKPSTLRRLCNEHREGLGGPAFKKRKKNVRKIRGSLRPAERRTCRRTGLGTCMGKTVVGKDGAAKMNAAPQKAVVQKITQPTTAFVTKFQVEHIFRKLQQPTVVTQRRSRSH